MFLTIACHTETQFGPIKCIPLTPIDLHRVYISPRNQPGQTSSWDAPILQNNNATSSKTQNLNHANKIVHIQLPRKVRLKQDHAGGFNPYHMTPASANVLKMQQKYYNLSNTILNPLDDKFTIRNRHLCFNSSVQLLILVPSEHTNTDRRTAIRNTFGMMSNDKISTVNGLRVDLVVRSVFVLGRSPNKMVEHKVRKENDAFKDIVQADFIDSYYNLTLKVLYGLKWVNLFCPDVKYVVKTDDDVFLNTAELVRQLRSHIIGDKGAVFGTVFRNQRVVQRNGKWAVSMEEFPLEKYPTYSQGNCYTLSGSIVGRIVHIAQRLSYLHIEDAFITGVVAGRFLKAKLVKIIGNSNWKEKGYIPNPCSFVKYNWVSTTNMSPLLMNKTWSALRSYKSKCAFYTASKHSLNHSYTNSD